MKRYLSLALIVLMLPALLAVPAMASETNTGTWVELLDYGYANGTISNYVALRTSTRTIIQYAYPGQGEVERCDILIKTDSTTFRASTMNEYLSVVSLGYGLYRLYGRIADGRANSTVAEFFVSEADGTYVEVLSFRVSTKSFESYVKTMTGTLNLGGVGQNNLTFPSDDITNQFVTYDNTEKSSKYFDARMSVSQWSTMDYIQSNFFVYASSIDSIAVVVNGMSVPFEVNYINTDYRGSTTALTYIYILIDVSDLPNLGNTLDIKISGYISANSDFYFSIIDCFGFIEVPEPSLWTYWFSHVGTWINEQTTAIVSPIVTWGTNIVNTVGSWGQSLLDGINALPDKIAEALQSVFVPSDSAVQNMGQQSEELAQDRFGGAYEGALIIDEFASNLKPQQATQILTVPVVNLDILGVPFPLGGWEVDLVPDGTEIVVETCKIIIDIIATLAFINGLRNRLERTLER